MGWFGYDLYDGDGTFTAQLEILEKAGIEKHRIYEDDESIYCHTCGQETEKRIKAYNDMPTIELTSEHKKQLVKAYPKIVKYLKVKQPKGVYDREDWAIGWQMFADLIVNNKLPMTKQIKDIATKANNWLATDEHCGDFNEPKERRMCVKAFGNKLRSYKKNGRAAIL